MTARQVPFVVLLAATAVLGLAGCGSNRIDPPRGKDAEDDETSIAVDSLNTWAKRARMGWAADDSAEVKAADPWAREAFSGVWADRMDASDDAVRAQEAEHLPTQKALEPPTPAEVRDALAGVGLAAEIVEAEGPVPLWQVVLRDPTGSAGASTEFWAWPDPRTPLGPPVLQPVSDNAPSRRRYGPEAVGALATYTRGDGAGLASAWTRPRGAGGLEVALLKRGKPGTKSGGKWTVATSRKLPIAADSVVFLPSARGDAVPTLIVHGAGARDRLFDACPTCPQLLRRQRYAFDGENWSLREERTDPTPYATIVAFMHALREGGPEAAVPYAAGPEVLEQVRELGLQRGPIGLLRAAPGTTAMDLTQRYRRGGSGGSDALEITLQKRADSWVVADLRPTRLVIE